MEPQPVHRRPSRAAGRLIGSAFPVASPLPCAAGGWAEFVARFGLPMRRTADRMLVRLGEPPGERVDDLVQDAFCRLFAAGPSRLAELSVLRFPQVVVYLERLVRSVAVDQWRAERAIKRGGGFIPVVPLASRPLAERVVDWAANPEDRLLAAELLRLSVARALAVTPGGTKRKRNTAILCRALIGGWSSREIALHLKPRLSASTVDTLLSRIRRRLGAGRPLRRPPAVAKRRRSLAWETL